jgi:hypothetical protein
MESSGIVIQMELFQLLIQPIFSQCSDWFDESSNFVRSRFSTLTEFDHAFDAIFDHLVYAPIVAFIWHFLKDKFKSLWNVNFPRIRKMVNFCNEEGISREYQSILIRMGVVPYLLIRYKQNQATTQSNYAEFKSQLEEESQSEWHTFRMLMHHRFVNIFQEILFVIEMPLKRCILNYIKARFF